ncbi:SDR family NAD(P)-dependent oxidoreductase [Chryseobacterium vrystaatense]|uniref:Short-chain dehydrogenase n=1 Tax=Chryseobacterium vrystaatense TaxID=307480 RepID=A0ABR4UIN2_9FLAO|nr:SDR family NAD(P)-dependent oxidoreductase [Chryseobacterium vrystaatense]KFF24553.1 short-chain dehydrogenase [Chryseobacterium vrystaatense]
MLNVNGFLDFSSKNILITGAGSGIGRTTAVTLSALGAELVLLDINEEALKETQKQCKNASVLLVHDLSDINGLKKAVEEKVAETSKLDGLINVAGIPCVQPLKTLKMETVEKVLRINTLAALELSKIFCSVKNHKGDYPSITYISSVYGIVGSAANVAYSMSKSALHGITKSLSIEMASKNIRVNCIAPGFIKTEMLEGVSTIFDEEYNKRLEALHPMGLGEAQDIANAVVFLASDMSRWITGAVLSVDGGFTAI